jgi:hypothetical protein
METCTYGSGGDAWEPTIVIWQGTGYLPYHAKLHTKDTHLNYTAAEKEVQAEMTAYTVSSYFGIDTSEYSLGYLSHWTKGKSFEDKTKLLKEVHEMSVGFIETIEDTLVKEREKISHQKKTMKNSSR